MTWVSARVRLGVTRYTRSGVKEMELAVMDGGWTAKGAGCGIVVAEDTPPGSRQGKAREPEGLQGPSAGP